MRTQYGMLFPYQNFHFPSGQLLNSFRVEFSVLCLGIDTELLSIMHGSKGRNVDSWSSFSINSLSGKHSSSITCCSYSLYIWVAFLCMSLLVNLFYFCTIFFFFILQKIAFLVLIYLLNVPIYFVSPKNLP